MADPVSVASARTRAQALVEREQRRWAAEGSGDAARWELPLHPPTERAALADLSAASAWTQSWRAADSPAAAVSWGTRSWPSVGRQELPERIVAAGADAIAQFAGSATAVRWRLLRDRARRARDVLQRDSTRSEAITDALRRHGTALASWAEAEFTTVLDVCDWLADNPASGYRVRQVPIRGVDSKWLGTNRTVVEAFVAASTGVPSLGLIAADNRVRVRVLDPGMRPGGLTDITAPVRDLTALDIAPRIAFVFENLESLLSMPHWVGAVAIHGGGYAIDEVAQLPWLAGARVLYWGDLDSHGFAILNRFRSHGVNAESVLMDASTLLSHRDLWVTEGTPSTATMVHLTPEEHDVVVLLTSEGHARLEQERIPWATALAALKRAGD